MGDGAGAPVTRDRAAWLLSLRRANELQEDELDPTYDDEWGEISDTHRRFIERFVSSLPAGGRILDAACGTGKYFGIAIGSGRLVVGVDSRGRTWRRRGTSTLRQSSSSTTSRTCPSETSSTA